tara:strand:- start:1403 stop:2152 length:750 start_codon:yes stop_codon:yes gene_type:complete
MDYRIAIPSYRRAKAFSEKTLKYLKRTDIDLSRVDLFLSDPSEKKHYEKVTPKEVSILDGAEGIGAQRNFIVSHYPEGSRIVGMDDDIDEMTQKVDDKTLATVFNLDEHIRFYFEKTEQLGLFMWGIYPVNNPLFMQKKITTELKYILAGFYGWKNRHSDVALVCVDDKEDFERSMKYYLNDGGVVRFNAMSFKTVFYGTAGGMQETRTDEKIKRASIKMKEMYPDLCEVFVSKRGKYELRLKDKRGLK